MQGADSGEREQMSVRQTFLAATIASIVILAMSPASSQTLRYANQGDLKSLDPYTLKETTTIAHHAHVYEGLVTRDKDLKTVPALAESWETLDPTHWRFHLRKGVKFHNGDPFTANDVIFSAQRVRANGSNFLSNVPPDAKFVKVADYTVDVMLDAPNPILISQWDGWYIMDKKWCEGHDAVAPTPASATTPSYASLHENGTGPFYIESHQPGVKTVFKAFPDWWGKPEHNLKEIVFTPIASDATRVAALLSGEVDVVEPVPLQNIQRVNASGTATVMNGPEIRTIFLGMDQSRDELLYSNVKGKNPFKDKRVRQAFYQAIDEDAIAKTIMRGAATPSGLMIAPGIRGYAKDLNARLPYDPAAAKKLLTEAGYPNGFIVGMNCPNDRYVNDAQICQAVSAMLAKIGVKVNLNAETKATYFPKILSRDTSFYLLGWTPGSYDSHNAIYALLMSPGQAGQGQFNLGSYSNKRVDELGNTIAKELDAAKRDAEIAELFKNHKDEVGNIPLHQQALAWGMKKNVDLVQLADNNNWLKWVVVKPAP